MLPKEAYLLRETIELLRKEARKSFKGDWRDADDWIFSELHFSKSELRDIFGGDPGIDFSSALEEPLADPCNDRNWIATDDNQRVRWMGGRAFKVIDMIKVIDMMESGDEEYRVIEHIVDVEERLRDDWDEVEDYLDAYGYSGVNDVRGAVQGVRRPDHRRVHRRDGIYRRGYPGKRLRAGVRWIHELLRPDSINLD